MTSARKPTPLLILGIDAGDPGLIQRWADQGYLPNLAALMARGCHGETRGADLVSEHGVWLSLFSGKSRGQHGYYYFRQLKPGTYDLESKTGMDIDAPPFWSLWTNRDHRRVAIVDAPDESVREGLPGVQLVNWASHHNWDPSRYPTDGAPKSLLAEIQSTYGEREITPENAHATFEEDLAIYRDLLPRIRNKGRVCRDVFSRESFDLYVTVFAESHAASHQFWPYCPEVPANADREPNELTHALRTVYQTVDEEIGKIIDELPTDINIVIPSSVGMEDDYPMTGISDAFFHKLGYAHAPPAAPPTRSPLDLARRLLPESWRIAISRQLFSREQREKLLADQFRNGKDWSRTRAFALPSAYTTFVRVNLRGREPEGIVEPGSDYEALLDEIERDFRALVDPFSGEPAVTEVFRTAAHFEGGPPAVLPDLFVDWRTGQYMERVVHPEAGEISQEKPDFFRRSDHASRGFFAAAGPDFAATGELPPIEVLDLAPTFLHLLGEERPDYMSGKVLPFVTTP